MDFGNNPSEAPPAHDERYRIITKLESGGMADIYLGIQLGVEEAFERLVVIKKIRARGPQAKKAMGMFLDEARVVASLNHPHIVQIYDLSRVKTSVCITMEYIDGENLDFIAKWLKNRDQEFPLSIICRLMIQACEALQYAHTATNADGEALNIIHRDIDLRNLMLDSNGYLKLIDFGVAKANTQVELTAPTMFKGKLSYIAPETFKETSIDHRVDIYALGLVFYQLVTGSNPFPFKPDANLGEVINTICTKDVTPPSEINDALPKEIDGLITKAIEKVRDERYPDATSFSKAIREFCNNHGGIAGTDEVKSWFNTQFEKRHEHRRKYEQSAMRKARDLAKKAALLKQHSQNPEGPSVPPPPGSIPPLQNGSLPPASVPSGAPPLGSNSHSFPYHTESGSALSSYPIGHPGSYPGSYSSVSSIPPGAHMTPGSQYYPDGSGFYPGGHPGSLHQSGMMPPYSASYPVSGTIQSVPPEKSANPYLLMIIAFILFTGGAILIHQLFFDNQIGIKTVERDEQADMPNLVVYADQENSEVLLDGQRAGTTGKEGLELWVTPGEMHNLAVVKEGYEPFEVAIWGKKSGLHRTDAKLTKTSAGDILENENNNAAKEPQTTEEPKEDTFSDSALAQGNTSYSSRRKYRRKSSKEPSDDNIPIIPPPGLGTPAESPAGTPTAENMTPGTDTEITPQPEHSPTKTPESELDKRAKTPKSKSETKVQKPWFSGEGNWSGADVARKGCIRCHQRGIDLRGKTTEEWVTFFRRKQHTRNANLDLYFSPKEQVRVLRYLLQKLQGPESD